MRPVSSASSRALGFRTMKMDVLYCLLSYDEAQTFHLYRASEEKKEKLDWSSYRAVFSWAKIP